MAFASPEGAADSRRAVSALMGLARNQGILATTTKHSDLTPGVAGKPPLIRSKTGGVVPAPDLLLLNPPHGAVIGVEVETRSLATRYPGSTFLEYAKLKSGILVELTAIHYARALKGEDYDLSSAWRQRDMHELFQAARTGMIDQITLSSGGTLLVLDATALRDLQELFDRILRGGT
jgi:hypothetical protein